MAEHLAAAGSRLLMTIPEDAGADGIDAEGVASSTLDIIAPGLMGSRT